MTEHIEKTGGRGFPWRLVGWGGVAVLLTLPLILHFPWTLSDFIFAGMMFGIAGLVIELAVMASSNIFYRGGVLVAVASVFLLIWVNGAVGFLGDENNSANLVFFGVIAIALFGSVLAAFRPAGMARAMFAAAGAQLLIGIVAIPMGWASPGFSGVYEVVLGTGLFSFLWLLAAVLLRKAAGTA